MSDAAEVRHQIHLRWVVFVGWVRIVGMYAVALTIAAAVSFVFWHLLTPASWHMTDIVIPDVVVVCVGFALGAFIVRGLPK